MDKDISELYSYMPPSSELDYNSDIMNQICVNGSPVDSEAEPYHEGWPTPSLEDFFDYPAGLRLIQFLGFYFELFVELQRAFVVMHIEFRPNDIFKIWKISAII